MHPLTGTSEWLNSEPLGPDKTRNSGRVTAKAAR